MAKGEAGEEGKKAGEAAGRHVKKGIDAAEYTINEVREFTSEFIKSFRGELKKKRK